MIYDVDARKNACYDVMGLDEIIFSKGKVELD